MAATLENKTEKSPDGFLTSDHPRTRRTPLVPDGPEVLMVNALTVKGEKEELVHVDEDSEVFEPQAVLHMTDTYRRERSAQEMAKVGFRSIQVDDLVTAYAVVTRLVPELILIDPSMCFEANWRDLVALRKFTRSQDCAMMVLLGDPHEKIVNRLADLGVEHVSLCSDPDCILSLTIRQLVLTRREIRELRETPERTA